MDYTTFEGLKILGSDEHKYDLDVGPGETNIILMRAEIQGFNMAASMTSTVHHGDNKLKQMLARHLCVQIPWCEQMPMDTNISRRIW